MAKGGARTRTVTAGLLAALLAAVLAGCNKPEESNTAPSTNPGGPSVGAPMGGAPSGVPPTRGAAGQPQKAPPINPTLNK